ncbi:hypothetical protein INT48_003017 [Thamnidium elegans]|uniref:GRIP domain-containing protein n=1 Tax=Thamnidium elegans TaxID=101142 RepID=A0A8H7VX76_9FUNG|nr:hypothetical protein INT48_003017 [Thamnidium elegans]
MTENADKTRALRAEKQVERLERELEAIKSRSKRPVTSASSSPSMLRDSDKMTFQLSEQVKDLKYQLKHQLSEYTKLQENSTSRTAEYEEKLKRMREIFGQASKNIDGYRASIASKDVEIEKLKTELEECQVREQSFKSNSETLQLTMEKLNTEITSQKSFYGTEIKRLESKNRQLSTQLEQTKHDYEQYKKRAHILLQKNKEQKSDVGRINELQELVQQMTVQKTKYEVEQSEKAEHQLLLEHDIRKAIDRIHELETSLGTKDKINVDLTREKNELEASMLYIFIYIYIYIYFKKKNESAHSLLLIELQSTLTNYQDTLNQLQQLKLKQDMTQRHIELEMRIHELEEANQTIHQQLKLKDNEIEKLIISTPTSPPAEEVNNIQPLVKEDELDVYGMCVYNIHIYIYILTALFFLASMSSLLSPLVLQQHQRPDERIGVEKQVQRLSEMLHESQDQVNALKSQEKVLKDELRKIDAVEKRQDMNVEYLKNVLIKFLMSENKQAMVPIIAKLLCLDKTETNTMMESCI